MNSSAYPSNQINDAKPLPSKKKAWGYVRIPRSWLVIKKKEGNPLGPYELLAMMVLAAYGPKNIFPAMSAIARGMRCSENWARQTIKSLAGKGFLSIKRGGGRMANRYEITSPEYSRIWSKPYLPKAPAQELAQDRKQEKSQVNHVAATPAPCGEEQYPLDKSINEMHNDFEDDRLLANRDKKNAEKAEAFKGGGTRKRGLNPLSVALKGSDIFVASMEDIQYEKDEREGMAYESELSDPDIEAAPGKGGVS